MMGTILYISLSYFIKKNVKIVRIGFIMIALDLLAQNLMLKK